MRAYTELLVSTCHRRGAHAIGGMAAFIPSRKDPAVNEVALAKVREDKVREATAGFDGTWVAHPDLVPTATAVFDEILAERPNQLERLRDDVSVSPAGLLDVKATPGEITEAGLRTNVNVGILYIESWLRGTGAAAIYNLMEDAATAEISRSQVWQWVRHGRFSRDDVRSVVDEELGRIRELVGGEAYERGRFAEARALFERVALDPDFSDFLTIPAYELLD
jgi:malate synthase